MLRQGVGLRAGSLAPPPQLGVVRGAEKRSCCRPARRKHGGYQRYRALPALRPAARGCWGSYRAATGSCELFRACQLAKRPGRASLSLSGAGREWRPVSASPPALCFAALVGLSFSGAIGLTFLMLGCALEYYGWAGCVSRAALLPAKGAAALTTQALGSAWCLLSSCRPDALLWLNNPFSTSTRVSIKMTEISAPLPQSDKCLLAQQSFLISYNSFCFVLATGTALWCLLLLKKQQLVAHACRWPYSSWGGWTSWPFRVPFNSNDSEARCRCSCRECWQRCMCRGVLSELPCLQAGIPLIWKKTFGSNPASASSSWWLQVLWGDANVKYIIWLCDRADPALWGHGSTLLLKVCG